MSVSIAMADNAWDRHQHHVYLSHVHLVVCCCRSRQDSRSSHEFQTAGVPDRQLRSEHNIRPWILRDQLPQTDHVGFGHCAEVNRKCRPEDDGCENKLNAVGFLLNSVTVIGRSKLVIYNLRFGLPLLLIRMLLANRLLQQKPANPDSSGHPPSADE
jgi:hypothetical protein